MLSPLMATHANAQGATHAKLEEKHFGRDGDDPDWDGGVNFKFEKYPQ